MVGFGAGAYLKTINDFYKNKFYQESKVKGKIFLTITLIISLVFVFGFSLKISWVMK